MSSVLTDIYEPSALTEFARAAYRNAEQAKPSLAAFLPNVDVDGNTVEVTVEGGAVTREAKFRALDAEPGFGDDVPMVKRNIGLLALSEQGKFGEKAISSNLGDSDERKRSWAERRVNGIAKAYVESLERVRASLLLTGNLNVDSGDVRISESFGRAAGNTTTAPALWSAAGTDILESLATFVDAYKAANNGAEPGTLLLSTQVLRTIAKSPQFAAVLAGGGSRPAGLQDVNDVLIGQGLPSVTVYDRANATGRLIPADRILLLPEAGERFTQEIEDGTLGGTAWGTTASSYQDSWGISEGDRSGIVAALFANDKPPVGLEVVMDAYALPVLANANLSYVAKVL